MAHSAYIHIPFCSHKCDFCDFAAFAGVDHLEDEYAQVVADEITTRLKNSPSDSPLKSVFYGGGTPGLVKPETLDRIHDRMRTLSSLSPDAEVTLETTPHSITSEKVKAWQELGINRVSIGVETLQDSELTAIGRDHSREQAYSGVRIACEHGFENVSCDFMYSLPSQTLESWQATLGDFVLLAQEFPQIKHVSAYGLHLANNSPLFSRFPKDSPSYPSEESFESMYNTLVETLEAAGFFQYEVSNFARPGFQSVHNLAYWQNAEYYGFGVSAHRYIDKIRSSNWRSLARYMRDFLGDETSEEIDPDTRKREAIMLGLRMRCGINLKNFRDEFKTDLCETASKPLAKLQSGGLIEITDGWLRLTQRGIPISNSVIAELI